MTYRRQDKIAAYEAAMKMIQEDDTLLNLPFGASLAAVFKMLRASTKLTGTEARQVAGKALRDARAARQMDILAESLDDCARNTDGTPYVCGSSGAGTEVAP